jgi:hypothetical protein
MSTPGVVSPATCPHCGAPLQCCRQGQQRGATCREEAAEGRDGGDATERATEAESGAQVVLPGVCEIPPCE